MFVRRNLWRDSREVAFVETDRLIRTAPTYFPETPFCVHYARRKMNLRFFGAQSFDEICGVKSLNALLDREDCADLEN